MKWRAQRTSPNVSDFRIFPLLTGSAKIVSQVMGYRDVSNCGYLPPIRGGITTSPTVCGTAGPGHGSFKVKGSQSGKNLERVHYYGFMGSVSRRLAVPLSQAEWLMVFPLHSWYRKECALVHYPFDIFFLRAYYFGQFHHHTRYQDFSEMWSCFTGVLLS
jgi:hypothetical protein